MKKLLLTCMVAMVALFAVACGTDTGAGKEQKQEKITVKHELGETEVVKNPKKVVVFDFGMLDSLDTLGIEVTGLPKDSLPKYLSKYNDDKYENVGGLKEPDFEKISEINPDLVIISGRQADLYEEFKKIAPTVYVGLDYNNFMESFSNNNKLIGQIFGKEKEVETELGNVEQAIKDVNEKASKLQGNALIVLANDGKISAYGSKSRFGIIHDQFGIKPVDPNIKVETHGQSISFEYIVDKNPDYLYVVDRGAVAGGTSSAKQVIENALIKKTDAYKNGNIVYLNPEYWYLSGGGFQSLSEMAKEIDASIK